MSYELPPRDPINSRRFMIAVRRLASGLSYGTDHSPFVGAGIEYVQSRPYLPGDPIKSIDWRVTARTRQVHVKEYESPKRLPLYLVVDTSASMTLSSTPRSKYALAVEIAGALALAGLDRISPVALVGAGERAIRFPASLSRVQVMRWLHELRHYRIDEQTELAPRLSELGGLLAERSLVVVLSDLHSPQALAPLKQLAQRHDCVAIQIRDPAEWGLPGTGFLRAREAETGRTFVTRGARGSGDAIDWVRELRRGRVDHLVLRTDQPIEHRLRRFFKERGLSGRGAR